MKTDKWRLYLGIVLLTIGIILRAGTSYVYFPYILILTGVAFKSWHVFYLIHRKRYKPGKEFWFLLFGLTLFFSGLYLIELNFLKYSLMALGVSFKAYFVVRLIRKTKS